VQQIKPFSVGFASSPVAFSTPYTTAKAASAYNALETSAFLALDRSEPLTAASSLHGTKAPNGFQTCGHE